MKPRLFILFLLAVLCCSLAPVALAQDSGAPATAEDQALFSSALANISGAASYAFDIYFDTQVEVDSEQLQILVEGEGAFDQSGASPALALDLRGRIVANGAESPVDFALRIRDDVLYYNNVQGSDTRPELWIGIPMSVMPALISSQMELGEAASAGDANLGNSLNALSSAFLEAFNASGVDPEAFLTLTRLPDATANGAPVTRMALDVSLSSLIKADGFPALLNALTAEEGQSASEPPSDAEVQQVAAAFEQTSIQFKVRIDPAAGLFQSGELVIDSALDPAALGETGNPIAFNLDLLISLRDIDEPQTITVPDGINVLTAEVVNALIQAQVTPGATISPVMPTPTPASGSLPNTGGTLTPNVPAQVTLTGDSAVEMTFNGLRGELVTISARSLDPSTGLDTTLELLDPNGVRAGFNDDLSGSLPGFNTLDSVIANVKLPSDGLYRVVVNSFAPGVTGPVEVLLSSGSTPVVVSTPSTLSYPIVTNEQRSVPAGGSDCINLDLLAGETVTIAVRALDTTLDTQATLNAPNGSQLAFNDDQIGNNTALGRFDSLIAAQPVVESGTHSLCISGFAGSGGAYDLTITREAGGTTVVVNPTATPASAQPEIQVITGEVVSEEIFETSFSAQAGDVYTITVRATGGDLDPQVGIFADNEDELLYYHDDQGDTDPGLAPTDSLLSNVIIQQSGVYDVLVAGYQTTSGPFEMTIERVATGAPLGEPQEIASVPGKLQSNGVFTFPVSLPEGAYVTITVMAGDDVFDPQLTLLGPNGAVVAANDDHSSEDEALGFYDSRIRNFFVAAPGEYTVEIRGYQGSGGPFRLTIASLP